MVSTPVLFDTNILIDCLRGIIAERVEITLYSDRAISLVTWMEVLAGATSATEPDVLLFLNAFRILPITQAVADDAVLNRRKGRLKLPDAIILATAKVDGRLLITRNTKDFPTTQHGVRVPYMV